MRCKPCNTNGEIAALVAIALIKMETEGNIEFFVKGVQVLSVFTKSQSYKT